MASGSLVPVLHATLSGSHLESTTSASSKTASYKVQTNSAATGATALTPPDGDIMSALLSRRVDQSLDPAQRQAASAALDIYIKTFSAVRSEMAATQVKNGKRKKRMSLVEAFEDEEQDKNLRWFYIPGINLVYTSIFEDPPSVLDLDRMLSHLSLLAALMLTIAMSLPMEFDIGEFEAARERFSTTQYRNYDTFESLYIEAMGYTAASVNVLGAAVSIIVVFSAFGRLDTDWTDEARREWWKLARWPVNGSFVLTVAGTTLCFFAFNRMTMLKVPDLYVEMYNATKKEVFPSLFASTYGSLRSWSIFFLIPLIVHCFVMVAWAKRRAAQEMHKNGLAISGKK